MTDEDAVAEFENVIVLRETPKAILVNINGHSAWIPKSQISAMDSEVSAMGDSGTLVVSTWIADEKGLYDLLATPGNAKRVKPKKPSKQLESHLTEARFGTIVSILEENMALEQIRVLVLTPKGVDLTEKYSIALLDALRASAPSYSFSIISAKAEFDQHFAACGGWEPWIKAVVARVDPTSRAPVYRGFILPNEYFGKATAGIVQAALQAQRQVLLFDPANPQLCRVRALEVVDPTDWQHGYRCLGYT